MFSEIRGDDSSYPKKDNPERESAWNVWLVVAGIVVLAALYVYTIAVINASITDLNSQVHLLTGRVQTLESTVGQPK